MRLKVYEQIWHGFGALHRHHLLMMDFDCPLAFRHKKGEYIERCFWHSLYLFFVLRGDFIFDWLELVELFRLYLGASLCILSFSSCHIVFVGLYMLRGVYFVVLVSNFLLIYDFEFFIIICPYCLCLKSRFLFFFTCIFSTHVVMHFV